MLRHVLPSLRDCLFSSIFIGALLLGSRMLNTDGDVGRHLALGNYILDTRIIPANDILSFTRAGESRPPYEWLSQVAFAVAYRLLELDGVVLLTALAIAAAFLVVFLDGLGRSQAPILALLITAWAAVASSLHWLTRPHVFSFVFFAIWLCCLERVRMGKKLSLWLFPALMLVWANTHGGFVLGLIAWVAYAVGWIWDAWRKSATKSTGTRFVLVGTLSSLASVATPDLWHNWDGVLQNRSAYVLSRTVETMPPDFSSPGTWPFLVMLALVLLVLLIGARRLPAAHTVLLGGLAVMSLVMARNIPFFAIGAAPIGITWLNQALGEDSRLGQLETAVGQIDGRARGILWPSLAVVGAVGWFSFHMVSARTSFYQFDPRAFPTGAVNWVQQRPIAGHMFNDFNWGGYLLFRLWPQQQVFIDSQSDFYGEEFTRQYEQIMLARAGWQASLDHFGIQWIIVPASAPLSASLSRDPSWRLLYADHLSVIFGKRQGP